MAELAKKLHLKKGTTEHLAKAYSTTAEAGTEYITNKIDGVTAYIPIGATNDSRATMGRVTKNGTKAILNSGKPPYTEMQWTTPGTYTFTVPAGVTRIRVAVCGGGGGGTSSNMSETAGAGGTSNFGSLLQATGGGGGKNVGGYWEGTEDFSNGTPQGGTAGSPNGYTGTTNNTNTDGFALSFTKASGSYGVGGYGNYSLRAHRGGGGGSGGYDSNYVSVTSGSTYSVVVGNGGSSLGYKVSAGTSGFVLIAFGGEIENG